MSVSNSLVANNRQNGNATGVNAQVFLCATATTAVLVSSSALKFKNDTIEPYDYHLQNGSVAIDAATTSTPVTIDVDGDVRPQGAGKDQGADEYKP